MLQIFYHIRRPVIVNLETSHLYTAVLHINPAIRNDISNRLHLCLILQFDLRNQYTKRHIITIWKSFGDSGRSLRHIVHTTHQIFDRHGRNDHISIHFLFRTVFFIGKTGQHIIFILMKFRYLCSFDDSATHLLHF